jgi:adenylyltransferase/sulfurtransferase
MMANETIKLITKIGEPLINRLLTFNALNNQFYDMELIPRAETTYMIPQNISEFESFNYDWFCGINLRFDLSNENFEALIKSSNIQVIDVREHGEKPEIDHIDYIHIPLSNLKEQIPEIDAQTIVLLCQTGKRSTAAAEILSNHYGKSRKIYSLKNGIAAWKQN